MILLNYLIEEIELKNLIRIKALMSSNCTTFYTPIGTLPLKCNLRIIIESLNQVETWRNKSRRLHYS